MRRLAHGTPRRSPSDLRGAAAAHALVAGQGSRPCLRSNFSELPTDSKVEVQRRHHRAGSAPAVYWQYSTGRKVFTAC
eukprot:4248986-Alexandrium_andersonii.AAC.1